MTTTIFYPDAHPETNSVDGYVAHYTGMAGTGISWASLIAAGNESVDTTTEDVAIAIRSDNVTDKFTYLARSILLFDTSSLTSGANITSATLSVYGQAKTDTGSWTPDINVYAATPATDTDLVNADFTVFGSTPFCDTPITYAGFSTSGYNDLSLNAAGLAAINKTGISKFGLRNANYDVAGSPPSWATTKTFEMWIYYADNATQSKRPKLTVVYTLAFRPQVIFI